MKAKVIRGSGFRGALNYVFDVGKQANDKKAERIGGNMTGKNPKELSKEFSVVRRLRPDINKPVWHCSLTLPAGERLSAEKWDAVASDFLKHMEFGANTPWVAVRHQDTEHDHIHMIVSRVGLDGKVWHGQWEARRAIKATQELENTHGLILTPGLGDARSERKALSEKEINMAVRTEKEPTRQRLQRLLDEAVKDKPTVVELANRLQASGVNVRANIAGTGRMNGFSFEIGGVALKGSDLGKRYTWAGLKKLGITYEQNRDREELERYRSTVADRGERQDVEAGHEPDARGPDAPTECSLYRDCASFGTAGTTPAGRDAGTGSLRQGYGHPAPDAGRSDQADERERSASIRGRGREVGRDHLRSVSQPVKTEHEPQQNGTDRSAGGEPARQADERTAKHNQSIRAANQSGQEYRPTPLETGVRIDYGGDRERDAGSNWASRFKQANAAKRRATSSGLGQNRMEQSQTSRARITDEDRQSARQLDPTAYLEANGYTVKREGRHLSVKACGDEVYRLTLKQDGRWLWCDRYGNDGGDNIDLVREIQPGTGYAEAVYQLFGAPIVRQQPRPNEPKRQPPKLPTQGPREIEQGREYLKSRGISLDAIKYAEDAAMVRYAGGSVLFVGYDRSGVAQNITRRAINPADKIQKRDLLGSDKRYPPILLGDPKKIWIVEGGTDALALYDMAKRIAKRPDQMPPTIIVSGGSNVLSFLDNQDLQLIIKNADLVTIAKENKKTPDVQAKADAGHQKQAQRVAEITGREVRQWTPKPEQGKDLADMNARQSKSKIGKDNNRDTARSGPSM